MAKKIYRDKKKIDERQAVKRANKAAEQTAILAMQQAAEQAAEQKAAQDNIAHRAPNYLISYAKAARLGLVPPKKCVPRDAMVAVYVAHRVNLDNEKAPEDQNVPREVLDAEKDKLFQELAASGINVSHYVEILE